MWTPDEVERFWSARLAAIRRARRQFVWAGIGFAVWAANLFLGGWREAGFSWRNPMGWVCVFLPLALACLSAGALVWLLKVRRSLGPIRETAVFVAAKCAFCFGLAAGGLGAFFLCIQLIMRLW